MADKYVVYFLVTVTYFLNVNSFKIPKAANDLNEWNLKDTLTQNFCASRNVICRSNDSAICAVRHFNGSSAYKDFRNHCYLFFSNVCGIRGEEFFSLTDGSCENYLALRRNDDESEFTAEEEETTQKDETIGETTQKDETTEETIEKDETTEETTQKDDTTEETNEKDETTEETNEKDETIDTEEKTESEITSQKGETTDPEENTDTEATSVKDETTDPEDNTDTEATSVKDETTDPEDNTDTEATSVKDETTDPEENTDTEATSVKDETTDPEENTDTETTSVQDETTEPEENKVENKNNSTETTNPADAGILRGQVKEVPRVTETFMGKPCPHSCPNIYKPVCFTVNKGFLKYFKIFYFVNYCKGFLHYCEHPEEYRQPPDEEYEDDPGAYILSSYLDFTYCGAYRFIDLARFGEVASSMKHYGWLLGDQKYSRIPTS